MMAGGWSTGLILIMAGGSSTGLNPDDGRRKFYRSRPTGLNLDDGMRMVYRTES